MSWSRPANRRLLWSILYASSHQPSLARSLPTYLPIRTLATAVVRNTSASTFSFGPEGDSLIAELASKQNQDDVTTEVAPTKPRGRKTKPLRQKEVTVTEHHDTVSVESSTDASIPTTQTTLQHQDPYDEPIESAAPVHSQPPQFPTPDALDEALTAHFRDNSRRNDSTAKQQRNSSREKRAERTPSSKKTKRDKPPSNIKKARESVGSSSHTNSIDPTPSAESTLKKPTENKAQPKPQLKTNPEPERRPFNNKNLPDWAVQKQALKEKFGSEGWKPRRKLSPDAMLGIRNMHLTDPVTYTTPVLAKQFKVSAEAIRRILKSKWLANAGADKMQQRREQWAKRHDEIWDQQAALGLRPGRKGERRVRDAAEGADEVEHELWAKETLEKARAEDPLFKPEKPKAGSPLFK